MEEFQYNPVLATVTENRYVRQFSEYINLISLNEGIDKEACLKLDKLIDYCKIYITLLCERGKKDVRKSI